MIRLRPRRRSQSSAPARSNHAVLDTFVAKLATLSVRLRAIASIHQLDSASRTTILPDFAKWHHKRYFEKTLRGCERGEWCGRARWKGEFVRSILLFTELRLPVRREV